MPPGEVPGVLPIPLQYFKLEGTFVFFSDHNAPSVPFVGQEEDLLTGLSTSYKLKDVLNRKWLSEENLDQGRGENNEEMVHHTMHCLTLIDLVRL
jgi:hypothetical protein